MNAGLPIGGTCVNVGCVPSKTLAWAAELKHMATHHNVKGLELKVNKFNFSQIIKDELALVDTLRKEKYEKVLANLEHVTLINKKARFTDSKEVTIGKEKLSADKFIIATGSTAIVPSVKGLAKSGYMTHVDILKKKTQPKELIVIGAGPQGLEFGQLFARFGTMVTILQRSNTIFPSGERSITEPL